MGIPALTILFGNVLQSFTDEEVAESSGITDADSKRKLRDGTDAFGWQLSLLGVGIWILSYFFVGCLNYAAENQVHRIRTEFLKAVLRQDVGWYDTNTSTDFASKMTE